MDAEEKRSIGRRFLRAGKELTPNCDGYEKSAALIVECIMHELDAKGKSALLAVGHGLEAYLEKRNATNGAALALMNAIISQDDDIDADIWLRIKEKAAAALNE